MRYPGAKRRMLKRILPVLLPWARTSAGGYVEPFLGSGAVARAVLGELPKEAPALLTDSDPWVIAVWRASAEYPDELVEACRQFRPRAEAFYEFRDRELYGPPNDSRAPLDVVQAALQKLALHAMSFGGLGPLAGSPIGGMRQEGKYLVDCRWSPANLEREIRRTAHLCRERPVRYEVMDFRRALGAAANEGAQCLAYLDPPYWAAGPAMYRNSFTVQDHEDLATALQEAPYRWVLSYDDHPRVHERYAGWSTMHAIEGTTQGGGGDGPRRRTELLLSGFSRPRVSLADIIGSTPRKDPTP